MTVKTKEYFILIIAILMAAITGIADNSSHQMELIEITYESCISPNGDGITDSLSLSAHIKGKAGKKVYAFLFIQEEEAEDEAESSFLQFMAVEGQFSPDGEIIIHMDWDGKDSAGNVVPDGNYQLQFYCLNFPFLFNSKGLKPKEVYEKLTRAINNLKDNQVYLYWNGQVEVNTAPVIANDKYTAVYGRVFDADTDKPLAGAVVSANGAQATSNDDGYWQLAFDHGNTFKIIISKDGYTKVYRKITLETGEEGVVGNAFLTPQDTVTTSIGPDGGTHANGDGTVEVEIPGGALDEVKDIQVTRLVSSRALPGDLNATDDLEYPIGFLFCADFSPSDTHFNKAVKIRVKNTWGFAPGTQIPYAYWDKDKQKWIPVSGMAD